MAKGRIRHTRYATGPGLVPLVTIVVTMVASVVFTGGAVAGATTPGSSCRTSADLVTCIFSYNGTDGTDGSVQSFVVPSSVSQLTIEAWGAEGGGANSVDDGGLGGYAEGTVAVHPGDSLSVRVGGMPLGTTGGYNGGADAGAPQPLYSAGAGGGATDVRQGGDVLKDRIVVAGGGGGGAYDSDLGSFGGGFVDPAIVYGGGGGGVGAKVPECGPAPCGGAGTEHEGGVAGTGASCAAAGQRGSGGTGCGGGGGGGYYGGGGGGFTDTDCCGTGDIPLDGPGGGGSGYVTPVAVGVVNQTGLQFGNGSVRISYPTAHGHGGLRWSAPTTIDTSGGTVTGVSCPSPSFCVAVDSSGDAVTYRHGLWSAPTNVATGTLSSVSCASATSCMAVGATPTGNWNQGLAARYQNGTWTSMTVPLTGLSQNLTGVSCVAHTSYCMAVGYDIDGGPGYDTVAESFNGHSWTNLPKARSAGYATGDFLLGVSCVHPTRCVAAGFTGDRNYFGDMVETDRHGIWSFDKITDANHIGGGDGYLQAVSCTETTACIAAGPGGYLFSDTAGQWSAPADVDGASTVNALSCSRPSQCVAVDGSGHVLTFAGGSWGAPLTIDPGHVLAGVSCPTPSFCVAVDSDGEAVIGR